MKRLAVVALMLLAFGCADETIIQSPTAPTAPEPILISGAWQGVVTSSTVPNAVWTMTLTQEDVVALGTFADDVNGFTGTVNVSVTSDGRIIGQMGITLGTCTASATVRGTIQTDRLMSWETDGWPSCPGAPVQVVMNWRK